MSDEVVMVPEDLKELYESAKGFSQLDSWMGHLSMRVMELIERIAQQDANIERLNADLESVEEALEAQIKKFQDCPHTIALNADGKSAWDLTCGCSHDHPDDVCALHAPQLKAALATVETLKGLLREWRKTEGSTWVTDLCKRTDHELQTKGELLKCKCGHVKGDHESDCAETSRGRYRMSACGACDCQQWQPVQPKGEQG